MKHKVERLEKNHASAAEQEISIDTTPRVIAINGLIEVEGVFYDGQDETGSDIAVSTVELGLSAEASPFTSGYLLILFEEGQTDPPEIDEAAITVANAETSPFSVSVGRQYVPFGHYSSALISDPLTLAIGETRETSLLLGWGQNGYQALAWAANGDTSRANSSGEQIDLFGLALEHVGSNYNAGISWINNSADTDTLQASVSAPKHLGHRIDGWSTYAAFHSEGLMLLGEYLSTSERFAATDLAFAGHGAKPAAWHLEVNYEHQLANHETITALSYQHSNDSLALGLPQSRWLAALTVTIFQQTVLAVEYAHDEDYGQDKGGSGKSTDTLTLQLAMAF